MHKVQIGERIRELREKKGITQQELAEKLNLSRETIKMWEAGERDIKTAYTVALAEFFGVECDYLLRGVTIRNKDACELLGLKSRTIDQLVTLKELNPGAFAVVESFVSNYERIEELYGYAKEVAKYAGFYSYLTELLHENDVHEVAEVFGQEDTAGIVNTENKAFAIAETAKWNCIKVLQEWVEKELLHFVAKEEKNAVNVEELKAEIDIETYAWKRKQAHKI